MTSPLWEFKVIHINVEDSTSKPAEPAQGAPASAPAVAPPQPGQPIFSPDYLRQEFPQHYAQQHPAMQLQTFLNAQGQEGWDFIGCFPLGSLSMMFFRRPQPAPVVLPPSAPPASQDDPRLERLQQSLDTVLHRLAALEARPAGVASPVQSKPKRQVTLPAPVAAPTKRLPEILRLERRRSPAPQSKRPQVLNLDQRNQLPAGRAVPTVHAAEAMGFRSYASLLGFGAKHGYRPGLVKPGPNGLSAVYLGLEKRSGGGKDVRLWRVVPSDQLPVPD
jgi:hypothetical protein